MSTQDASSSPGLRKGTFGTPMGIKWRKNEVIYLTLMWKRKNEFIVLKMICLYHNHIVFRNHKKKRKTK